jgi:formate hydrogenlyase transcriptional activator
MEALAAWEWPGNIRELENLIERAVILSRDGVLRVPTADIQHVTVPRNQPAGRLIALEREAIVSALRDARGIVGGPSGAAERLGLKRTTLQSRMRRLGIRRPSF